MRNWKNWLFPILTALTVAALSLLPLRLSTLEDGRLAETVHAEPLTADNNFPSKPPELPGRVWLLAQYQSVPNFLTIVGQEPEEEKLAELSAQARTDLQRLVALEVLPEHADTLYSDFQGSVLYLRDQQDLSSAAFAALESYDNKTGGSLGLYLDGESGRILALELTSELLWDFSARAETIGAAFLDSLGLECEPLHADGSYVAVFRLTGSGTLCVVYAYKETLHITLEVDWKTVDDGLRAAAGYPPEMDSSVDAGSMQKW